MVSVIIPVYNSHTFLRRAVFSALSQGPCVGEVIIVDDGSQQITASLCDELSGLDKVFSYHIENSGVSAARAYGVEKANDDWIFFLDADDVVPSGALASLVEETGGCDIVVGNKTIIDNNIVQPDPISISESAELNRVDFLNDLISNKVSQFITGRLIRKSLFPDYPVPRYFKMGEDFLLNVMLGINAKQVRLIDTVTYEYYVYSDSVSHTFHRSLEYESCYCRFLKGILEPSSVYQDVKLSLAFQNVRALKGCFMAEHGMIDIKDSFVQEVISTSKSIPLSRGWRLFMRVLPFKRLGYIIMKLADAR